MKSFSILASVGLSAFIFQLVTLTRFHQQAPESSLPDDTVPSKHFRGYNNDSNVEKVPPDAASDTPMALSNMTEKENVAATARIALVKKALEKYKKDTETTQKAVSEIGSKSKEHKSAISAKEEVHVRFEARDAIVVTTGFVNECVASRLRQLVESSQSHIEGVRRDVWVLHSHYKFDERYQGGDNETFAQQFSRLDSMVNDDEDFSIISNDTKLLESQRLIASIPGLRSARQSVLRSRRFDTKASGSSKSSFLKLLVQQKYRFGWHLEDDVFYTGQWGALFDALDPNTTSSKDGRSSDIVNSADVLPIVHKVQHDEDWWADKECYVDTGEGTWPHSIKKCQTIEPTQTGWMAIRLSGGFASSLLRDLNHMGRSAIGHHECIVGAYAKTHNFTVQAIPQDHIGLVEYGGWGKWIDLPASETSRLQHHAPIHHNKLYHPVKCSAYPPGSFDKDLKKFTTKTTKD